MDITSFLTSLNGKVKIETSDWFPINIGFGRNTFNVSNSFPSEGPLFHTTLNFPVLEKTVIIEPIILKVDFCEGESLIIGSPELPVRFESTHRLIGKNVQISHSSWHFPHKYTV